MSFKSRVRAPLSESALLSIVLQTAVWFQTGPTGTMVVVGLVPTVFLLVAGLSGKLLPLHCHFVQIDMPAVTVEKALVALAEGCQPGQFGELCQQVDNKICTKI